MQEGKLLSGVVNKLGDPSRKVASKAGYLLTSLLQEHPAMKVVVVAEVQRFMFRQGLQERARYYGVIFLNQMVLSHQESQGTAYVTIYKMKELVLSHYESQGTACMTKLKSVPSRYYGVIFLNQIVLSHHESQGTA